MEEYTVRLDEFEGPMELLLELTEKEKLNISEISLASVCDQFLAFTRHFEEVEPRYLANFLVIASRLILIKSKALLPFLELTKEEEEDIDELKEKLIELKKIRKGMEFISNLEDKNHLSFQKQSELRNIKVFYPPEDITKDYLFEIFSNLKDNLIVEKTQIEEKKIEPIISFEEKVSDIRSRLEKAGMDFFHNVTDKSSKINMIISFLAVLELIKQRFLFAKQNGNFKDIKLVTKNKV